MSASKNSDFFLTGFCSCKACIHAIHGNKAKWSGVAARFLCTGMYGMPILQEQKIGDAVIGEKVHLCERSTCFADIVRLPQTTHW